MLIFVDGIYHHGLQHIDSNNERMIWGWRNKAVIPTKSNDQNFTLVIFVLVCLTYIVGYFGIKWMKQKLRPKRKRPPKLRKIMAAIGNRIPAV